MRICLLVALLLTSACVTPEFNYVPERVTVDEPAVGSTVTARVGDTLLRRGTYTDHQAIRVTDKIDIGWAYELSPGYYLKQGEDDKTETYLPSGGAGTGRVSKVPMSDPWTAIVVDKDDSKICIVTSLNVPTCTDETSFERVTRPGVSGDDFQQALIYGGKTGDRINIGYREYSNDHTRPPFNNDVGYDLSESAIIQYKGAQLEVLEATSQSIRYKVLSGFDVVSPSIR